MIVKNKYSEKEIPFTHFRTWDTTVKNKQDYLVVEWGDLVMAQQYQKDGSPKDLYVMGRDHAKNMCKLHEDKFRYRPLSDSDWESLRESVSDSPEIETDHLFQATPPNQPKQKPEKNKSHIKESESMTNRLLKIAPLGIWITAIVSLIVALIGLIS